MTITVVTNDVEVSRPVKLTLADHSGAHVILTVSIENRPPITHVFDFEVGELRVPLSLPKGKYHCSLTVQAFKHGALNGMYASEILFNKKSAGRADGNIDPPATFDVGFEDFNLTVK